jgi:hypothetical protein
MSGATQPYNKNAWDRRVDKLIDNTILLVTQLAPSLKEMVLDTSAADAANNAGPDTILKKISSIELSRDAVTAAGADANSGFEPNKAGGYIAKAAQAATPPQAATYGGKSKRRRRRTGGTKKFRKGKSEKKH